MKTEEKLKAIKWAVESALEGIAEAKNDLINAERETGYAFGHHILQELEEQNRGTLAWELNQIAQGLQDEEITSQLNDQ